MTESSDDGPKVAIHPPTLFFCALVVGFIIRVFAGGWLALPRVLAEGVGGGLIIVALGVAVAATSFFAEAGEALKPSTPSKQLFTDGPFKWSRNPIYLAMVVFGVGFGVATLNLWIILTSVLTGATFHFFVIPHEEEYLARRFGDEYEEYRNRVRRWI